MKADIRSAGAEEAFRIRLAELGATLIEPRWLGSMRPHRVRCIADHDCRPVPSAVQQGRSICSMCTGYSPLAAEAKFRARLAEAGATLLEPAWLGSQIPHRVRCAARHICWPRPSILNRGIGICRACAGQDPVTAEAEFRARLIELGATLLEPHWLGARTRHRACCAYGHDCKPMPYTVQQGGGICAACAGKAWDVFYVVMSDQGVKFGITSGDPLGRLSVHRRAGYHTVTRLLTALPGSAAPDIEQSVRSALALAGETPTRGREYYDRSALPSILDVVDHYPLDMYRKEGPLQKASAPKPIERGQPRPHGRTLTAMRRTALAIIATLVAASALTAFAESYRALYLWAAGHGLTGIWSALWPIQVDVFVAIGELALIVALADGWSFRSRIAAWVVTLAGLAASVAGNIGHVQGHDWASRATAAVPPLAAAAALAVGLGVLKRLADRADWATARPEPVMVAMVAAPEPVTAPATAATSPAGSVLDPAELAALDSGAKRARLAAARLGTDSPATVAAALADAGHPATTEAVRSALRNRPGPASSDPAERGGLALAPTGTG